MLPLKPWREIAQPHEDVLRGSFQQAEFAADLSRVHAGTATEEYQDPVRFFHRTFITEGMRLLLDGVVRRLAGKGGDPVIQLQTAFGGGKTHTMLAVYHLASGRVPASELLGVSPILDKAGITDLPKARLVVLDGINLSASQPARRDGLAIHTLWGQLAYQLGGASAYERIQASDQAGTSPAKDTLTELMADYAPCVILIDELVAYLRQFEEGKSYPGGTFDSNLTFIQSLTEAIKAVPTAIVLASLPESHLEVGSAHGQKALDALEKYFGRVQALWKPVATEEAFEIVRRRLFVGFRDDSSVEAVCRAYADLYAQNPDEFPPDTQEAVYLERLRFAYPIHPEVFDRLYQDWSTLDKFQRTRGVLKLMAKVVHRLWNEGNTDLLIMPGSLPLDDTGTRNEAIHYLPQGWDPVIDKDIDSTHAETRRIDEDSRFGALQAGRRTARTIFLGSAPSTSNQNVRGLEQERILLGCVQPGQQTAVYKDALRRLTDRLHYLNGGNNRFWFDTRPNLRREMEDRKRRFNERDDVYPELRKELSQQVRVGGMLDGVHVFAASGDVPDDMMIRLVILSTEFAYSRSLSSVATDQAQAILRMRGEQPRQKQNRLLFLVADSDVKNRLIDQVKTVLAWRSIEADIEGMRLNLDQFQQHQAKKSLQDGQEATRRMVREAYRWLLVPQQHQPGSEIDWEATAFSTSSGSINQEIESKLKEQEWLIVDWSPIHLANLLKTWFWKKEIREVGALDVWQKTLCYLYLPRLRNEDTFKRSIDSGINSKDWFGLAYGKTAEGSYQGFQYGQAISLILDASLLLIEPQTAAAYQARMQTNHIQNTEPSDSLNFDNAPTLATGQVLGSENQQIEGILSNPGNVHTSSNKKSFYAIKDLSALKAKTDFAQLMDEVVQKFSARHDVTLSMSLEIQAETDVGFDEKIQRDVKENCNTLKFRDADFH